MTHTAPVSVLCCDAEKLIPTLSSFCQPLKITEAAVFFIGISFSSLPGETQRDSRLCDTGIF